MNPGVHHGIPMAEYLALPYLSASALEEFRRSPAHYRARQPKEPTDAMKLGTAVHMALLEPALFAQTYVVATPCVRILASGARKGWACGNPGKYRTGDLWFCGTHAPDEHDTPADVVTLEHLATLTGMRDAVLAHPEASKAFQGQGGEEVVIVWDDPTGIRCKARPDRMIRRAGMLVDLKSASDASPRGYARDGAGRGTHRKMALYRRGLRILHGAGLMDWEVHHAGIIAVESSAPYVVGCYLMDEGHPGADMERAEVDVERSLARLAMCQEHDEWPGYGTGWKVLKFPEWSFDIHEEAPDE